MITILLTIILSPIIIISHVLLIWTFNSPKDSIKFMILSFLIYFIIWIILINIFSETINFSNREIIPSLALIIFFSLGYAEFFSMIGRGFSLRILTDIYINKSNTKQQIVNKYGFCLHITKSN